MHKMSISFFAIDVDNQCFSIVIVCAIATNGFSVISVFQRDTVVPNSMHNKLCSMFVCFGY